MLAIVIPYYKFLFFEKTLQSLSDQTDKRFKVYIGNDASNSNPDELIQKYSKDFPIFYEKFENNLGGLSLVNQWNRCLQLINDEEWLMILGDDDVLGDNVVSTFYQELEEIKLVSNVVRFSTVKINETGKITSKLYQNEKIESSIDFLLNGTRSSLS
jgi:glycosyltransferase involved in cell wall biosynthesis